MYMYIYIYIYTYTYICKPVPAEKDEMRTAAGGTPGRMAASRGMRVGTIHSRLLSRTVLCVPTTALYIPMTVLYVPMTVLHMPLSALGTCAGRERQDAARLGRDPREDGRVEGDASWDEARQPAGCKIDGAGLRVDGVGLRVARACHPAPGV